MIGVPDVLIQEALAAEEARVAAAAAAAEAARAAAQAPAAPPPMFENNEVDHALDNLGTAGARPSSPSVPGAGEPVWQPWSQVAAPPVPVPPVPVPPVAAPQTGPFPWQPPVPHVPATTLQGYEPAGRQTPWPGGVVPQPYAPAGQMPAYVHTPAPMMVPPETGPIPASMLAEPPKRGRAIVFAVIGTVIVLGAGLAIGRFVLGWGAPAASPPPAAAAAPATTAPAQPAVAQTHPVTPTPTPGSAAAVVRQPATPEPDHTKPTPVAITTLEHPLIANVTSPMRGTVASVLAAPGRELQKGDKLLEITHKQTGGAEAAALEKRIAELQALVKQDPATYQPFLMRARRDLERAQPIVRSVVTASAAGVFDTHLHAGASVNEGDALGTLRDGHTWTAMATTHDAVTATWSCAVADATHTAACKIQSTEAASDGTKVSVVIDAGAAPWLEGLAQHPNLIFAR